VVPRHGEGRPAGNFGSAGLDLLSLSLSLYLSLALSVYLCLALSLLTDCSLAQVNLTLSYEVADDMVNRYKCIPFFLNLTSGTHLKHAQFSAIAIGNLARKEV
jgi:hypothetical protein